MKEIILLNKFLFVVVIFIRFSVLYAEYIWKKKKLIVDLISCMNKIYSRIHQAQLYALFFRLTTSKLFFVFWFFFYIMGFTFIYRYI